MNSNTSIILGNKAVWTSVLAILFFGFSGAAVSPFHSAIAINELGISDKVFSLLTFGAAGVSVVASVLSGIFADRLGSYRVSMMFASICGVIGFGMVWLLANGLAFGVAKLTLIPLSGMLYSLIFAYVKTSTSDLSASELISVNAVMRATISVAWVIVPVFVGLLLVGSTSMLPAFLLASLFSLACLVIVGVLMPSPPPVPPLADTDRYRILTSLGEIAAPGVSIRVLGIALICSMLHTNDLVRPVVVTGKAGGSVADIGVIVAIVAVLEVIFIFVWARIESRIGQLRALAAGTAIYGAYLVLQGLASQPWHVYALTTISGFGAAALIVIPIGYLQQLVADRPGLGSSLISVNMFLGASIGALVFALGTSVSDYSGASILGAGFGVAGVVLLMLAGRRAGTRRRS